MLMWIFSAVRGIHNRYSNSGDGHKIDSKESRSYLTFPGDGHHAGHINSVTKKTILGHLTAHHLREPLVVGIAIGIIISIISFHITDSNTNLTTHHLGEHIGLVG